MSFSVVRSVANGARALLKSTKKVDTNVKTVRNLFHGPKLVNLPNRCFTRSLWHLSKSDETSIHKVHGFPKMCGCCGLHTQGDKDMAAFLSDEIQMEKDNSKHRGLPRVRGFEMTSTDGTEVVLTRKANGETINIRCNVNHSIDDEPPMDMEEKEQPEMMSQPAFTVEISKEGSSDTLAIQCQFPQNEDMGEAEGEQEGYEDLIEITEVALLKNTEGDWSDKEYAISGSIMDGNLYDMLLNKMEERGVNEDFVNEFVEFCTAFEHKKYITFLEDLKVFTESK